MKYVIKRNKAGLYNVTSRVSGEQMSTKKWITEEEVKKILIKAEYFKFMSAAAEIDMSFPTKFVINGKKPVIMDAGDPDFYEWMMKRVFLSKKPWVSLRNNFIKIKEKLKFEL